MAKKYLTQGTMDLSKMQVVEEFEKSKTVPGQSYTIQELLALGKRGLDPKILREVIYEMDAFGEELNPLRKPGFDLTDMNRIQEEVKQYHEKTLLAKKRELAKKKEEERKKIIQEFINEKDADKDGKLD